MGTPDRYIRDGGTHKKASVPVIVDLLIVVSQCFNQEGDPVKDQLL